MFDRIERGLYPAVTSTVTLLELLVQPYRDQKDELVQKIFAFASTYPKLEWVPVTMSLTDRAAELRARYRLSAPDAIQLPRPSVTEPRAFTEMIAACGK